MCVTVYVEVQSNLIRLVSRSHLRDHWVQQPSLQFSKGLFWQILLKGGLGRRAALRHSI